MANEFSITSATNAVQIDAQNQAVATFTVYNASGREVNGRAALETVPADQPHGDWLQIEGERERRFAIGGTEQYAIKIAPPAGAAPNTYTFRLNMVETANPDEGFNPGTSVTFTVPEPKEPEKKFPIWIIPLIVGLVIVIGLAAYFLTRSPKTVAVPDVVGMTAAEAQDALEDAGFRQRQGAREFSNVVAENLVVRTDPEVGAEIEPDSRVVWFLSNGQEPTPTPTHTPTPTITPTPTDTPTPTPDLTATTEAAIEAAIAKYRGNWVNDNSQAGFLTRFNLTSSGRTISIEAFGNAYYVAADAGIAALGCPLSFPVSLDDCAYFSAEGEYAGDPMTIVTTDRGGITHELTLSITADGGTLGVLDQVRVNGVVRETDTYALKRQRPFAISTLIFVPIEVFENDFILPSVTLSP